MTSCIVWNVDPIIFGGFQFLRWYGLCWAVGMVAGYQVMSKIYKHEGLAQPDLDKLTIYVVLGAIIGARLGHIIFYDPVHYINNPIEILPVRVEPTFQFTGFAGLASHGGVSGALLALYMYSKRHKQDFLWILDRLTIAGALAGCFIRLGNLMNSEILGKPTEVPWAFLFVRVDDRPRHPAQLYEAVFYLLIAAILFLLWKSGKGDNRRGFLFGLGFALIFIQRFLIEFLKENQVGFEQTLPLNMGQVLSLPLVLVGAFIMVWSIRSSAPK